MKSNGVSITVYSIEHFVDRATYDQEVEQLIAHVKSSRPQEGFKEILFPGEPEFRTAARRRGEGIEVDSTTWERICGEAREFGLDPAGWGVRS